MPHLERYDTRFDGWRFLETSTFQVQICHLFVSLAGLSSGLVGLTSVFCGTEVARPDGSSIHAATSSSTPGTRVARPPEYPVGGDLVGSNTLGPSEATAAAMLARASSAEALASGVDDAAHRIRGKRRWRLVCSHAGEYEGLRRLAMDGGCDRCVGEERVETVSSRRGVSLAARYFVFVVLVPGTGAVLIPWWILRRNPAAATAWLALVPIGLGLALFAWCAWVFATVGRGTPAPWDAPRHLVVVGPFRWVRNPIYLGAFAVILGEAWLFTSVPLLIYAGEAAIVCHLFVIGYEERTLRRRFGYEYVEYQRTVRRWIPRRPASSGA